MVEMIAETESVKVTETTNDTNGLSSEKIRSLRAAIDAKLHEQGIYDHIRDLVHVNGRTTTADDIQDCEPDLKYQSDDEESRSKEDQFIDDVLRSEVVQNLLTAFRSGELAPCIPNAMNSHENKESDANSREVEARDVFLYLRLSKGKAFVDQLVELEYDHKNEDEKADAGMDETKCPVGTVMTFFRVNATFQKQRQASQDIPCCVDPPFDEHFRFRIEKKRARTVRTRGRTASYAVDVTSSWEALCLVEEPVQFDLVKVTKKLLSRDSNGIARWRDLSCELLAVHRLDWRRVMCSTQQLVHFPVELTGRMKQPVGSLDVRADLLHWKRTTSNTKEVRAYLSKEALQRNASNHSFYKYAKQWWDEYRCETHTVEQRQLKRLKEDASIEENELLAQVMSRQRLVKMFAEDEEGSYRMVCKFVVPLRVSFAVRSPSEAARFVGLLPYESNSIVGGGVDETWRSIVTVLSIRKGNAQDHSILLASLLLGCGLDAYVCIGTISASKRASQCASGSEGNFSARRGLGSIAVGHVWVLTRGNSSMDVLLWESVTGEKCALNDIRASEKHGYCAIDCVFNNRQYFANLQPRSWNLSKSSFDFDDETCWKRMDENLIADLPFAQPPTALLAPNVALATTLEVEWTTALKRAMTSRRKAEGLVTAWSDELSFYLLPALNSYELERLYGVTQVDNNFFQQSVSNFVQEGHTFQGVPFIFTGGSPDEALTGMTSNSLVTEILTLHGRSAQFAIAVRCFPYAQHTIATWVMLAVTYQNKS